MPMPLFAKKMLIFDFRCHLWPFSAILSQILVEMVIMVKMVIMLEMVIMVERVFMVLSHSMTMLTIFLSKSFKPFPSF